MAAAAVQRDVMQMFYGPPRRGRNAPLEGFVLATNHFQGWLHVWKMEPLPERPYNQGDIYRFGRAHKKSLWKK